MGRSKRKASMEHEVPVKLSDQQLLGKARELTTKLTTVRGLRRNLSAATRRSKDEIKALEGEIEVLRQEISDGFELLPQGSLFAQDLERLASSVTEDGKLPQGQAAQALGKIAEKADASKPKPTEPHEYATPDGLSDKTGSTPCIACGSPYMDPVHHGGDPLAEAPKASVPNQEAEQLAAAAAKLMPCPACEAQTCRVHPHAFNPPEGGDGDRCRCGFAKRAKVHKVEAAEASTEATATDAVTPPNGTETETTTSESGTVSNVVAFTPAVERSGARA